MKRSLLLLIFSMVTVFGNAQNLILNSDFEDYNTCPTYLGQVNYLNDWINPTTNIPGVSGSPDFIHGCTSASSVGVPQNSFGYQFAHSGSGYVTIGTYSPLQANYREYIETTLAAPLVPGMCYQLDLYISLADKSHWATNGIGALFLNSQLTGINNFLPLPYTPQVNLTTTAIIDTMNWTLLSATFIAGSPFENLIIGNFNYDSTTVIQPTGFGSIPHAVYYIDDVSLVQIPSCNTGIHDNEPEQTVSVFPSPFTNYLNIKSTLKSKAIFQLTDKLGRILIQKQFTGDVKVETNNMAEGIYFYKIVSDDGSEYSGKLIRSSDK